MYFFLLFQKLSDTNQVRTNDQRFFGIKYDLDRFISLSTNRSSMLVLTRVWMWFGSRREGRQNPKRDPPTAQLDVKYNIVHTERTGKSDLTLKCTWKNTERTSLLDLLHHQLLQIDVLAVTTPRVTFHGQARFFLFLPCLALSSLGSIHAVSSHLLLPLSFFVCVCFLYNEQYDENDLDCTLFGLLE